MANEIYDICIVGGGINGTGIAADAAGRGLKVLLCEKDDLASATSSKSSKLIHGGLRYLETYEFALVRKALKERELLLQKAPHLINELRFILPIDNQIRPAWLIRIGLWLYDHLYLKRSLSTSQSLNLATSPYGYPLKNHFNKGFIYSDCWVDDARLVINNALAAQQLSATILTRTECIAVQAAAKNWKITLINHLTNQPHTCYAKVLINATGPWAMQFIQQNIKHSSNQQLKLVKGSHIILPQLYNGDHAYILQNADKRIVFVMPFQEQFTLIGTTEVEFSSDLNQVEITEEEIIYLCQAVNNYFKQQISPQDVIRSYAGVRPLHLETNKSLSAISRDYSLELEEKDGLPWLNIFGGKITTYRLLAEEALVKLQSYLPNMQKPWTANTPLPGGDFKSTLTMYIDKLHANYSWLALPHLQRYVHAYGTLTEKLLANVNCLDDLGEHFGADLYEKEVRYLIETEWAQTADDILWRRSKLGLILKREEIEKLQKFMANFVPNQNI